MVRTKRSLRDMDHMGPNEWDGDFSDGRTFQCRGCGSVIAEGMPVVFILDEDVDLENYWHPSCYVLGNPDTDLADWLRWRK